MEGHLNKEYTLAELEPGWIEETHDRRSKTAMRMHGSLRMTLRRVGRNPENSRQYVHGDPVHLIDWKAFARTDQLIVREQRDEASATVAIVIDLGATMEWPSAEDIPNTMTKAEVALRSALWLAHAHLVMGDSVECWLRRSQEWPDRRWVPRSPADVLTVYAAARDQLTTKMSDFFLDHPWVHRRVDTLWLLTDALEPWRIDEVCDVSGRVMLAHVLSSKECDVQWMADDVCYMERVPTRRDFMGEQLKHSSAYLEGVKNWRSSWQTRVARRGGSYFLATDTTPVGAFFHWVTAADDR